MFDDRRLRLLAYLAAAALLTIAAVRYLDANASGGGGGAPPVELDGAGAEAGAGVEARTATSGGRLYVHVAGEVRRPGLYRLPAGARVAEAIERAGGPRPKAELAAVNLAEPLEDGRQVIVPRRGEEAATASGDPPGTAGMPGAKVSLATATPEQLQEVDGIGPALSARIIEYRDRNGGFRSVDQLQEVDGIGEKRFERLREAVRP